MGPRRATLGGRHGERHAQAQVREERTRAAADPAIGISTAFSSFGKRGSLDQLTQDPTRCPTGRSSG